MEALVAKLKSESQGRLGVHLEPMSGPGLTVELLSDLTQFQDLSPDFNTLEESSQARRQEWAVGRRCLLELKRSFPEDQCSLSHNAHLALGVSYSGAVGVDVERADRQLSESAYKRISKEGEPTMAPLLKWCVKEAAFKASSHAQLVSEFKVLSFDGTRGRVALEGEPSEERDFLVMTGDLLGESHTVAVVF